MKFTLLILTAAILLFTACNTVSEEVIGTGDIDPPDTTGYYSTSAAGVTLRYKIENDQLHCILSGSTTGWIAVGFNPSSMMQDADFIIGYFHGNNAFIRDEWGTGTTTHAADVTLGGTDDVTVLSGNESEGVTELEFSIPLNSGDQYDQVLEIGETYTIILARGDIDDFSSYHSDADYATIELFENGGGNGDPGEYELPDTTLYLSLTASDMTFYWLVEEDSLKCIVKAATGGWIGIGFDPESVMLNADFIMGYVQDSTAYMSDEWGTGPASHTADTDLGGTYDIGDFGGFDSGTETIIYFTLPLNSGDLYDKELIVDQTYPLILAYGNADNFVGMHSNAAFSSFTVNNETGGGDDGVTTGGDISGDDDTEGFSEYTQDEFSFKWKIVGDSLRCMVNANTTGWIAVGFDPEEAMLNANLIIGYVSDGTAYVRDDWGVSEFVHTADVGLGGVNNVTRVFGHQSGGGTEIRFTIPLNSSDPYDKVIYQTQSYEIILAYGFNGADDFSSMHWEAEDFEVEF